MKKYFILTLIALLLASVLSACGSGGAADTAEYLKDIKADKYITLGEYKGLEVSIAPPLVTAGEVDEYIAGIMRDYPMKVESEGPSAVGDEVNIDFRGTVDGEAFENGTAEGSAYTLGSYQFIPELDEGMVGMSVGDVWDIPVTFPEEYHIPELAGQEAVFNVTMNSIMTPVTVLELNDEYVAWLTAHEFTNVEEFQIFIGENMQLNAEAAHENEIMNQLSEMVLSGAEIKALPAGFVSRITAALTENMSYYAMMNGLDLETYMLLSGMLSGDEDAETAIAGQAETSARLFLAYQAIADIEGLNVTDAEADLKIAALAESAGMTAEEYKAGLDFEGYKEYLMMEKVSDFLLTNAVIKES